MYGPATQTGALLARAAVLHAELADVVERARFLLARGREQQLSSTRVIRGGSDPIQVTTAIMDARLCLHCIARRAGVPAEQVDAMLRTVARTVLLRVRPHRCDDCLQLRTTFSATRDG